MKRVILALILGLVVMTGACKRERELKSEEVSYQSDVTLKGYLAYDNKIKTARPGILIVHEWWGHNEYVRERAKQLAKMGYTALAIDMYGEGKEAKHPQDAAKFSKAAIKNIDNAKKRFEAALELIKNHPTVKSDQIAAIGYCFGGGVVLHMARMGVPDLKGVVSFHGSVKSMLETKPKKITTKILVCHGADDKFIPEEDIKAFKLEMEKASADYKFISYPGAKHSFTNPAADSFAKKFNLNVAYNKEADKESWKDMQEFFDKIFK